MLMLFETDANEILYIHNKLYIYIPNIIVKYVIITCVFICFTLFTGHNKQFSLNIDVLLVLKVM